jgi:hypothetical protein
MGTRIDIDDKPVKDSYVCSYSKNLRHAIDVYPEVKDTIRRHVESLVNYVIADKEIADSLKVKSPGGRILRQMDIRRDDDNSIILKTFIHWNWDVNVWHVLVEGPDETCFEKGEMNYD